MAVTFNLANRKKCSDIIALYNEVTLQLHRKGIHQWDYPWRADIVKDAIDRCEVYTVEMGGNIIGAFCIGRADNFLGLQVDEGALYLSKIAILPNYQGLGFGRKIVSFTCILAKTAGKDMYLDCWAGNHKLREFYTGCGLEYLGDFPEDDYFISVFKSRQ
ncbi:GNAT family N-acetyltransferase [Neobacillus sp. YIM B06451]|uniref:GNAT family N-acetyltransferase n=1 Tax=Neobacillus sp. YIM B06451 TaxID=3070994 RepID=UPI002930F2B7|nr:GNAT family N-acetyltransferase [Neobacillus sp. YIM B06451]